MHRDLWRKESDVDEDRTAVAALRCGWEFGVGTSTSCIPQFESAGLGRVFDH
jgi:hypothetical protein